MKISEEDPGIAVCEYCQSRYVLEREGDDARLGGAVSAQRRQMGTPAPKPAKKPVLWPAVTLSSFIAVLILVFVFVPLMQEPDVPTIATNSPFFTLKSTPSNA